MRDIISKREESSISPPSSMREIISAQKALGNWILQSFDKISKETIHSGIPQILEYQQMKR